MSSHQLTLVPDTDKPDAGRSYWVSRGSGRGRKLLRVVDVPDAQVIAWDSRGRRLSFSLDTWATLDADPVPAAVYVLEGHRRHARRAA